MEQSIGLKSIGNARELGGFTAGGRNIRRGVLLRTASLATISDEDKNTLVEKHRLAYIIDLRMSLERSVCADPEIPGAENCFLPVMEGEDFPGFDEESARMLTDPNADRFEMIKRSVDMGMMNDMLYVDFLFSDRGKEAYRRFFETLSALPEGRAILWHCTDGKDRTGVAAMLVLSALGAERETILRDYMLTNTYNEKKLSAVRPGIEQAPLSQEMKEMALFGAGAVYERFMTNAMDAMVERCGSVTGYLSDVLGIGEKETRELRHKYLEEE